MQKKTNNLVRKKNKEMEEEKLNVNQVKKQPQTEIIVQTESIFSLLWFNIQTLT